MKADAVTLGSSQRLFSAMLDNQAADEAFIAILKKNSRIAGHAATAVYRNNTIGTRKRTLQAIYPVVEKILGASCFDMLASDFVNDSPSIDSDLNLYSQGFPNFLHKLSNNEAVFSDLPYLQDLAMLEWLYHKAYYMADDAAITPDQFAGIDSSVKIERSRALFCIRTTFPIYDIWTMHQGSESVSEVTALSDED